MQRDIINIQKPYFSIEILYLQLLEKIYGVKAGLFCVNFFTGKAAGEFAQIISGLSLKLLKHKQRNMQLHDLKYRKMELADIQNIGH